MLNITENEILNRLRLDNPWWETGGIELRFSVLQRRIYFEALQKLIRNTDINRAVVLMGPRRVGKTVLVYHSISDLLAHNVLANQILYLSLETPVYIGLSLEKIAMLFADQHGHDRNARLYLYFDEIQYLKDWEVHLKSLVDTFPNYRFIATGSAAAALKLRSQESGAGRFTDFILPPLNFHEYLLFTKQETLVSEQYIESITKLNQAFIDYINYGGYPEAIFSETVRQDPARFIKNDIIDKVLLRDLPNLYGINDIQELNRLFTMLAYNTGQEISLEQLAQNANIAKNTLRRYIEYLEAAFLIRIVHRVDQNAKRFKRVTRFKVYLTNPSMRAALFGPVNDESEAIGALVETAIYAQLFHAKYIDDIYYARWDKGEVDIIWLPKEIQRTLICMEVKWSDLPYQDHRKIKAFFDFLSKNESDFSVVTTKTVHEKESVNTNVVDFIPSALMAYIYSHVIHKSGLDINSSIRNQLKIN